MRAPSADLAPDQSRVLADIAETGVHIALLSAGNGRPEASYTVGLWHTYGQPEVLVVGLEGETAADLLEHVTDEVDAGRTLAAEQQCDGLIHGYPVRLCAVTAAQAAAWLPLVGWAYEGEAVPCVQLVYPDKQGRWPWQSDVRQGFRALQPVLAQQQERPAT